MKNLRILPFLLSLLFLFGCDLIDKIRGLETFEVDFDQCINRPVNISETDPDNIDEIYTISASNNPDLVDYLNDIEGWDVVYAYLQVFNFIGDEETSFSGTVSLGDYVEPFTDIKPYEWSDGRMIYLDLDNEALAEINEDLNNDNKVIARITGTVSHQPVSFDVYFCIQAIVEVKAKK
jgi:hypothetical protein